MKKISIPSRLYYELITHKRGDRLAAVYCILKAFRKTKDKFYAYKAKNNKTVSGYALLKNISGLSLHTLKEYVPQLIKLGLCHFDEKGNFVIIGADKIKERFKKNGGTKLVPINTYKQLKKTELDVIKVRFHAAQKSQIREIAKKKSRLEILMHLQNTRVNIGKYMSASEIKTAERIERKYGNTIELLETVVLSNEGFSNIKRCPNISKSSGQYWRAKLNGKILKSRRRFKLLKEMSYTEYLFAKRELGYSCYTYIRGCLAIELVPSLKV